MPYRVGKTVSIPWTPYNILRQASLERALFFISISSFVFFATRLFDTLWQTPKFLAVDRHVRIHADIRNRGGQHRPCRMQKHRVCQGEGENLEGRAPLWHLD